MMHRLVLLLLIMGCLLFAAILFIELVPAGAQDAVIAQARARPEAASVMHRQQSPKGEELVATALARPLFSSTRRPPQSTPTGNAADTDLADKRLTGIVTTPARRVAIFAVTGDKPLMVAEGEDVSGWRVESITPREVSLSGPGGTKTLQPKLDPNLVPPPGQPPIAPNLPPAVRPPAPPVGAAVGRPNPAVPINVPGVPPRPPRSRQQR
jgi:hypothetical protein